MPQTKPDKRFESHTSVMIVAMVITTLTGAVLIALAARSGSTVLWIAVGSMIGFVALGGIAYSAWIFCYYRCPGCRCRLRPEPGPRTSPLRIRYHCERCDIIWDSGITWGGE